MASRERDTMASREGERPEQPSDLASCKRQSRLLPELAFVVARSVGEQLLHVRAASLRLLPCRTTATPATDLVPFLDAESASFHLSPIIGEVAEPPPHRPFLSFQCDLNRTDEAQRLLDEMVTTELFRTRRSRVYYMINGILEGLFEKFMPGVRTPSYALFLWASGSELSSVLQADHMPTIYPQRAKCGMLLSSCRGSLLGSMSCLKLEAEMAILDEIDSGLDVDALQDVAKAVRHPKSSYK